MIIQFCSSNDNLSAEIFESARGPFVIFCHGFPGRNLHLSLARVLEERGIGSIVFRYRGVDGQAGRYNILEQESDIQALAETVRRKIGFRRPLAFLGYSLGGI